MRTSRAYETNDYNDGLDVRNLDQIKPQSGRRFSPIRLRSDGQEYRPNDYNYNYRSTPTPTPSKKKSNFCSKPCLIGLCIGLLIGIALVIAIAVPIGVTRCGSSSEVIVTTCPSTTTVSTSTSTTATSCIGVISSTPVWTGTFLMDSGCQIGSGCCCLYNTITVNQTSTPSLLISGVAYGSCTVSGTVSFVASTLTNFQATIYWNSELYRIQLGQDNAYLAFVNTARPYCSATALRRS